MAIEDQWIGFPSETLEDDRHQLPAVSTVGVQGSPHVQSHQTGLRSSAQGELCQKRRPCIAIGASTDTPHAQTQDKSVDAHSSPRIAVRSLYSISGSQSSVGSGENRWDLPQPWSTATPGHRVLSRLLLAAHGITAELDRGPNPSAGGLQALELYLVHWASSWLAPGLYHYNRARGIICLRSLTGLTAVPPGRNWSRRCRGLDGERADLGARRRCCPRGRSPQGYGDRAGRFLLARGRAPDAVALPALRRPGSVYLSPRRLF